MTYRTLIEQAKMIAPGNTRSANDWLIRLADVLKAGELMPSERSYLYRLRRVWRKRAAGEDARWNVHGSRAGARPIPRPIAPLVPRRAVPEPSIALPTTPEAPRGAPETRTPPPAPVSSLLDKYR